MRTESPLVPTSWPKITSRAPVRRPKSVADSGSARPRHRRITRWVRRCGGVRPRRGSGPGHRPILRARAGGRAPVQHIERRYGDEVGVQRWRGPASGTSWSRRGRSTRSRDHRWGQPASRSPWYRPHGGTSAAGTVAAPVSAAPKSRADANRSAGTRASALARCLLDIAGHQLPHFVHRPRRPGEPMGHDRLSRRSGERRLAGEHLVQDHAERVESVRPSSSRSPADCSGLMYAGVPIDQAGFGELFARAGCASRRGRCRSRRPGCRRPRSAGCSRA